ncbi:MAG: patatin-like phospholipase family protein [Oscillospiraceae bacterium]|jgi:NTE family protein|nr:patatin-like phospholipase family protein [Oscillospiraceae bacterium]
MFGLALEGGGTLGAAHIGVLRALQESGLVPSSVSGTSAGAIVAGAYAWRGQLQDVEDLLTQASQMGNRLLDLNVGGIINLVTHWVWHHEMHYTGVFKGDRLEKLVNDTVEGAMLAEARLPLAIPAVDLVTGELVIFASRQPNDHGLQHWVRDASIAEAVRASTSIPGIFVPKGLENQVLVDGGVLQNLPVAAVRQLGEDRILGVSLRVAGAENTMPKNLIDVARGTLNAISHSLERSQRQEAAFVLDIILPEGSGTFTFDKMPEFVDIGYETTIRHLPQIKKAFAQTIPAMSRRVSVLAVRG